MIESGGAGQRPLPTLNVYWDSETQAVGINFDSSEFKTWDFVLAVLDMAKQKAEFMKRAAEIAAIQKQQQEAIHNSMIRRQLKGG